MGMIIDFFRTPQTPVMTPYVNQVLVEQPSSRIIEGNQVHNGLGRLMVPNDQDADQILRNVQQNNFGGANNITNVVEQILAQNGLNIGLHKPNYVSPMLEYVRKTKLHRGWKVPKFTKFCDETNESTTEHVSRY